MTVDIAKKIKELAKEKKITLENLAEDLGINYRAFQRRLANNNYTIDQLEFISDKLDFNFFEVIYTVKKTKPDLAKTVQVIVQLDGKKHTLQNIIKQITLINSVVETKIS